MQPSVLPGRAYDPIVLESRAMLAVRAADYDLKGVGEELPTFIRNTAGGSVLDAVGQLYTPVYGQPRFQMVDLDADGVRETPVLVIEPQRTNVIVRSEELNNGVFGASGCTVTADDTRAPSGSVTAEKLDFTSGSGFLFYTHPLADPENRTFVVSIFLRDGTLTEAADRFLLQVRRGDGSESSDFSVGNGGLKVAERLPNGWTRWYCVKTFGSSTTGDNVQVLIRNQGATGYYYAWGEQMEESTVGAGAIPTSYVATAAAVVTRNADILRYTIDGLIPQEMTVYLKVRDRGTYYTPQARLLQISAADNTGPRFMLYTSAGNAYLALHQNVNGGATVASTITPAPAIDAVVELVAQFYDDGAVQIHGAVSGGAIVSGAKSAALAPAAAWSGTIVHVGANALGTEVSNYQLLELRIVPGVRSLTQCREIL